MKNVKTNKGITLIALIITIIILLILAMVSIRLVINGGILTKAESAVNRYNEEQLKEKLAIAYSDYKLGKYINSTSTLAEVIEGAGIEATVEGNDEYGYIIEVETEDGTIRYSIDQSGIIEKLEDVEPDEDEPTLEEIILGPNGDGQHISEFVTINSDGSFEFTNHPEIVLCEPSKCCILIDDDTMWQYIKYNNKIYRLEMNGDFQAMDVSSSEVDFLFEIKEDEGKKVYYSYDGTETNKKEWTVLKDNGSTLEIVCSDSIGDYLDLGYLDKNAVGNTEIEKAINSYEKVEDRINKYCKEIITNPNTNKNNIRSFGYNKNSGITSTYTVETSNGVKYTVKNTDYNFEEDYIRYKYYNISVPAYYCLIPSRYIITDGNIIKFAIRNLDDETGVSEYDEMFRKDSSGEIKVYDAPRAHVSPVVTINKSDADWVE